MLDDLDLFVVVAFKGKVQIKRYRIAFVTEDCSGAKEIVT